MAFLDAKEWQFGRQNVFACTVGASDLPTSSNLNGVIQVGDMAINLSGAIGQPIFWQVSAASSTSVTWTNGDTLGGGNTLRSVAASTTLLSTDRYLFITATGTITLPAPNTTLGAHQYEIKAVGASAQPVTIAAASGGNLDSVTLGAQTISANESVSLWTDGATNWYTVGRDAYQQTVTPTPPYTLSTNDKYVIASAGSYTLPAGTIVPVGYEYVIHATGSSVTLTPASGTYNGAAAGTLTANATARLISNGTNYFTVN